MSSALQDRGIDSPHRLLAKLTESSMQTTKTAPSGHMGEWVRITGTHASGLRAHTAVIIQHWVQWLGSSSNAEAASSVAASSCPLPTTRSCTSAKNIRKYN